MGLSAVERAETGSSTLWLPHGSFRGRWRADEGFDGCPRGTVGQRSEAECPVVAKLLPDRRSKAGGLEAMSLDLGSLEAGRAVVGGVYPVAATLDWPD